jgi:hypothetical protein
MHKYRRIIAYLITITSLIAIGYYMVQTPAENLQSSVVIQYGITPDQTADATIETNLIYARVTASGSSIGPISNIPTSYAISIVNNTANPVEIHGAEFNVIINDPITIHSPPIEEPLLVHTYNGFNFEAAEFIPASNSIRYAGSNVINPNIIPANSELFLYSFTTTYPTTGTKTLTIDIGRVYLSPLQTLNAEFENMAELDIDGQVITFRARQSEHDLGGTGNTPDGRVNPDDVFEIFRSWSNTP